MRSLSRFMSTASPPVDFEQSKLDPFFWACYVAWIGEAGNCADTARLYLSGIQTLFAELGLTLRPLRMSLVERALNGLQKEPRPDRPVPKKPITVSLLRQIYTSFKLSEHEQRTVWAMMTLATYGLLRCGELTLHPFKQTYPRVSDWKASDDHSIAAVYLPTSKSDKSNSGTSVYVAGNSSITCPISAMHEMLTRSPFRLKDSGPIFTLDGYHPISRYVFLERVRRQLSRSGLDATEYSGHSFRRGGAQSAYDTGLSIDDLQLLGRWKQPQVAQRYYGFTQQRLRTLSHSMAQSMSTNPLKFELLRKGKKIKGKA